jgi:hypothetical protein
MENKSGTAMRLRRARFAGRRVDGKHDPLELAEQWTDRQRVKLTDRDFL